MKNIILLNLIFIFLFLFFNFFNLLSSQAKEEPEEKKNPRVRLPVVDGQFYPGDEVSLLEMIQEFEKKEPGKKVSGKIRGLISPHAGYIYSGIVAEAGYRQIDTGIKTVFVLAPSHSLGIDKASIMDVDIYRTPLGDIPLSPVADILRQQRLFSPVPLMDQREHSLEVQLPFLQHRLKKGFALVPIVIGQTDPGPIAGAILPYIVEDTLIVASSDLSHYYPYHKAMALDKSCTQAIVSLDFEKMPGAEACGKIPILVLMEIAKQKGWKAELIDLRNSGDTSGPRNEVVGYASIAFVEVAEPDEKGGQAKKESSQNIKPVKPKAEMIRQADKKADQDEKPQAEMIRQDDKMIRQDDKKILLDLARQTISEAVGRKQKPGSTKNIEEKDFSLYLKEKLGCFVTLHKNGQLRGCIGTIIPEERLCDCVKDNALNAAFHDPRFSPLREEELDDLEIEISVLTQPKTLDFSDSEDLKKKLRPGQDGVILSRGWHRATYLPQVWEQLPDIERFLESLCQKAGLPKDAWKNSETRVEVYEAIVFSEK